METLLNKLVSLQKSPGIPKWILYLPVLILGIIVAFIVEHNASKASADRAVLEAKKNTVAEMQKVVAINQASSNADVYAQNAKIIQAQIDEQEKELKAREADIEIRRARVLAATSWKDLNDA